ncbi:hypothetical protein CXB51_002728 [Gossypium anomalum]|uniref:DUF7745 domain-containing protein n=1 Tax=Gossypium anomalum TaxID=47600 RepID=A0A8J5ZNS9_9ROSI|nr:hypothetical protein CXB51_002728 [Gossypium anomalum]
MGYDRGFVLVLVDDSTNNSSTCLELKPHIVNRTSHLTRAMSNFRPFSSHQNKCTGGTPLTFCIFTFYTRGFGLFNKLDQNSEKKWDSLVEGCIANLPEHVTVNVHQNNLEDLVRIWNQWDSDTRGVFTERYGDVAHLITINIDERLILAMIRFWDPAYQCFTFNPEDMIPDIEEYTTLLRVDNIKQKIEIICIPWSSLRDLVLNHPHILKRVNLFALAIYGLIILPKVLGHIEVAVVDFFERLKQGINSVPTILAETFRSLSSCRRKGEGRFIERPQLLNVWILSHFWKVERTPFHMFSKTFTPLEAYLQKEWPKENLRAEDVTWRAPWIRPSVLLYKVGDQDWVPLLGFWGGVGYAPLLVQRKFSSRQFIPATGGLAQSEFTFAGEGYIKKVRDTAKSWKKIHLMELALYADTLTQDYDI